MGVFSGRLKRGVLGAGTARKRGVLGAGLTRKKGGLRCGSGKKRGVFTAAHTYTEHICEYPPRGPVQPNLTFKVPDTLREREPGRHSEILASTT